MEWKPRRNDSWKVDLLLESLVSAPPPYQYPATTSLSDLILVLASVAWAITGDSGNKSSWKVLCNRVLKSFYLLTSDHVTLNMHFQGNGSLIQTGPWCDSWLRRLRPWIQTLIKYSAMGISAVWWHKGIIACLNTFVFVNNDVNIFSYWLHKLVLYATVYFSWPSNEWGQSSSIHHGPTLNCSQFWYLLLCEIIRRFPTDVGES